MKGIMQITLVRLRTRKQWTIVQWNNRDYIQTNRRAIALIQQMDQSRRLQIYL